MPAVGIIANPASGKDIRRLVAYGTVFDNLEKVNIVRRILLGLAAAGVDRAVYMPDYFGIVPKAVEGLYSEHRLSMEIVPADIRLTGTQVDSCEAAAAMREMGVGCIITLGGDGTNRMVAKGCKSTPLLPVSTGTNNVFPRMVEGTIAGLAAGAVAGGKAGGPEVLRPSKMLAVYKNGEPVDIALIDAVVLKDKFIGSRAMWEVDSLRQAVVTRGEAHNIGIASIVGNLAPVGVTDKRGMVLEFDPARKDVMAPIAPGLIVPVGISSFRPLELGGRVEVEHRPCIIALDGEREVELKENDQAYIELTFEGPRVVDVKAALKMAVDNNYSRCREKKDLGSE